MKKLILLVIVFFFVNKIYCQKDSSRFVNEYNIWINKSTLNFNQQKDYGFGLGAYHYFTFREIINVITGLEYNQTRIYIEDTWIGHFEKYIEANFYVNSISIPLNAQLNFSKKFSFFLTSGTFLDINLYMRVKGIIQYSGPDQQGHLSIRDYDFKEIRRLNSFNTGILFGYGFKIPISNCDILIRNNLKVGFFDLDNERISYNAYFSLVIGLRF